MDNLLQTTLVETLWAEIVRELQASASAREIRLTTTSFPPKLVLGALIALEQRITECRPKVERLFKVAKPLYTQWQETGEDAQAMAALESHGWLDSDDKLTFYRNQQAKGTGGLVTVLVGVDKVLDQGGLESFNRIDDARLFQRGMGNRYHPWVSRFLDACGIEAGEPLLEQLDEVLCHLDSVTRRDLVSMAAFWGSAPRRDLATGGEVLDYIFRHLDHWGLFPAAAAPKPNERIAMITASAEVANRFRFHETQKRKQFLGRIEAYEAAIEAGKHDPPELLMANGSGAAFESFDDFADSLRAYIDTGKLEAKERLAQTDFALINMVLGFKPERKEKEKKETEKKLSGSPLTVLMEAVWSALWAFRREQGNTWLVDSLAKIEIVVDHFQHDLGVGEDGAARELFTALLGGVESFISIDGATLLRSDPEETVRNMPIYLSYQVEDELGVRNGLSAHIRFRVLVHSHGDDVATFHFRWMLDPNQPERVLFNLASQAWPATGSKLLPAFSIPTLVETCFARDELDACRLLGVGAPELSVVDLLAGDMQSVFTGDPDLRNAVTSLALAYRAVLASLRDEGYFAALDGPLHTLHSRLATVYQLALAEERKRVIEGDLGSALAKAYLLLPTPIVPSSPVTPVAVAFGLTPSVLEQLQAREYYLKEAFPRLLARLIEGEAKTNELFDVLDMMAVQRPIQTLIRDDERNLASATRSLGQVHVMGAPGPELASLASAALRREEEDQDDDIPDADMFRMSLEAQIFADTLRDYYREDAFPWAADGMRVLALDVDDPQTLIAGVDHFLKWVSGGLGKGDRPTDAPPFRFALRIYLRSLSALGMQHWLESWRRRYDPALGQTLYPNCTLSIAYRPVSSVNAPNEYERLLESDDETYDVAFLNRVLRVTDGKGDRFDDASAFDAEHLGVGDWKFPITETPYPRRNNNQDRLVRQTNLSNRRLRLSTLHAEVVARLNRRPLGYHHLLARADYAPWKDLIDAMHAKGRSQWVVIMDPSIDSALLKQGNGETTGRELVGFTSGCGGVGDLNVTISTEADTTTGLRRRMRDHLSNLFPAMRPHEADQAAGSLVAEATSLSGFSLVKALSSDRGLRETVAHALARRAIPTDSGALCDVLLSLDTYQHWFSRSMSGVGGTGSRPDLLHLVVKLDENGHLAIAAHVIECKVAEQSEAHLEKARQQVTAGLKALVRPFLPAGHGDEADAYMRRSWWAQLQRAIAAHSVVADAQVAEVATALEWLGEGRYSICWSASILTFWVDVASGLTIKSLPGPERDEISLRGISPDNEGAPNAFPLGHSAFGHAAIEALFRGEAEALPQTPGLLFFGRGVSIRSGWCGASGESNRKEEVSIQAVATQTEAPLAAETVVAVPVVSPAQPPAGEAHEAVAPSHAAPPPPEPLPTHPPVVETPVVLPAAQSLAQVPKRVLLGKAPGDREVYWEFGHPELTNRHLLIFGKSGSGKTYAIQCILAELARQGQNALIVDYTEGFGPSHLKPGLVAAANPKQHVVRNAPLPLNPVAPLVREFEGIGLIKDKPHETAARVMSVIDSVFNLGEQQRAALVEAVKVAIAQHDTQATLEHVLTALENDNGPAKNNAATLANKLKPLVDFEPFAAHGDGGWDAMYDDPLHRLHIVQLMALPREIARVITEFALWDLYNHATRGGTDKRPLPIVLDEAQNLSHALESPVGKILREGRKFGVAGILATQTISNLAKDEQSQMFQAAHKLFFMPAETEAAEYAKLLATATGETADEWRRKLVALKMGECWSYGPVPDSNGHLVNRPLKVRIASFMERGLPDG